MDTTSVTSGKNHKTMKYLFALIAICLIPFASFAALDSFGAPIEPSAAATIVDLASKYPIFLTVISVIGLLRLLVKPIFSIAHAVADWSDTPKDDEFLARVESSKILKGILFVLDYVASVKVVRK